VLLVSFGCFFEGVFLGASSTLFNNILTYLSKKSFSWGLLSLSCVLCCASFFVGCIPVYLFARPFGFLIYNTLLIKKKSGASLM
jgi:hypothetical protein